MLLKLPMQLPNVLLYQRKKEKAHRRYVVRLSQAWLTLGEEEQRGMVPPSEGCGGGGDDAVANTVA